MYFVFQSYLAEKNYDFADIMMIF